MSWNGTSIGKTDSVGITDIWNALGKPTKVVNGAVVNDYTINSLARHANINPLSLYKPMSVSCGKGLESARSDRRFKGLEEQDMKRLNYGYEVAIKMRGKTITDYVRGGADPWASYINGENIGFGWAYIKPKGGEADPFRYGDFRGYNAKNEEAFVLHGYTEVGTLPPSYSIGGQFPHDMSYFSEDNWYWGVLLVHMNNRQTSGVPIVTNIKGEIQDVDIDIPQALWTAAVTQMGLRTGQEFRVIPILHNTPSWHGCSHAGNILSDDRTYTFTENIGLVNTEMKTIPAPILRCIYDATSTSTGTGGNKPADPTPKVFVSIYDVSISGTTCTFKTKIESTNGTAVSSLSTYITTYVEGMYNNYDCASDESGYGALRTITNGGTQSVNFSYNAKYEDDYGLEHTIRLQHGTLYISVWTERSGYYYPKGVGEIEF